jgi:hypothetical protein
MECSRMSSFDFPPPEVVHRLTEEFLWASDALEAKRVLEAHPWLMSDYIETELRRLQKGMRDKSVFPDVVKVFDVRIDQLRRCRELGTTAGLFGQSVDYLADSPGTATARELVRGSPYMLSDEFLSLIDASGSAAQEEGDHRTASRYAFVRALLDDCRTLGIDVTFDRYSVDST